MSSDERILLTGGDGRLGTELRSLVDVAAAPTVEAMDITDRDAVRRVFDEVGPDVVVHAAAYTDVAGAETERRRCWDVNVNGTLHVAGEAGRIGAFLVHISTDYVFDGSRGGYAEDDPPGPVCNYYALTKLAAEVAARSAPEHLVLRTSFRPRHWPYPVAFTDVYTSQDYVDVIAPMLATAIRRRREIPFTTLHVAAERKSVFDLARRRRPDVRPGAKAAAGVTLPDDVSLDVTRWAALSAQWSDA